MTSRRYLSNEILIIVLYRLNELGTEIIIIYIDDTLAIGDKPALVDTVECIKK